MTTSPRSIFRERAMKQYIQRRQKDVVPHLIAAPLFLLLWVLLGLLLIALLLVLPGLHGLIGG
ncbi:MAG: hypothetical protein JOZ71_09540 [Ktedonobacteraceae bacterium]|nr:hypothetical protein [Ktedonobacteraceae bacterium]